VIVKVNFQLATAPVPPGYLPDSGLAFGDRGNGYTYGWDRDITADSRERNVRADKRYDTLIHFQKGAAATWEIVIPNGKYDILMVCGDPSNTDQTNTLDVEGLIFTDPNGQTGNFDKYTGTVEVKDGRLTVKPAAGASNAKISFIDIIQVVSPTKAQNPIPEDKAVDIPRDTSLVWTPAETAEKHNVYLGTDFADVNGAGAASGVSQGQTEAGYEPPEVLAYGQTYYWRIDEVNAAPDNTIFKGDTWSFTVEPFAYPIENITATASSFQAGMEPQNAVNGAGLNADDQHSTEAKEMWLSAGAQPNWIQFEFDKVYKLHELWVWNSNQLIESFIGFGAKDVTVEYSADGETWAALDGVPEFAKATAAPTYAYNTVVPFSGVLAKYVKLTINASWGGLPTTGLSEVRFFYIPVQARLPEPAAAGTDVALDATLNWRPGREADAHVVYLGTDADAVADGTAPSETVADHSFAPPALQFGTTYFWKVDETGGDGPYEGEVWSFTTQEYAPIDDFESYNDDDNRIYDAWLDGWVNNTGSLVGYEVSPFAEQKIVHGGGQSMPFEYDNAEAPFYSEAEREFSSAQNWTVSGADSLSLWVRGTPAAFVEDAGTVTMSAAGHDIWDTADDFRFAYKTLNGNGSIVVKVESLVNTNAWAKAGVMIRQNLGADSKFVYMIVSYSSGVSMGWRAAPAATCGSVTQTGVAAPQWVKLTRTGEVFTAQYSVDGKTWTDLKNADGTVASTTVIMTNPAYVGLCVTSHNTAATTVAVLSGAATTGNVTGASWTAEAIGDDPQETNSPESLYVTVEDSAGKTATVTNATAVTSADWTQWQIPLSDFAGVNMSRVKKMYLGVGSKTAPVQGGAGMLYIDDIGYGHPAATE